MVKHWVSHEASEAGRARRPQHERLEADRRGGPGHGEEVGVEDDARGGGLLLLVREHRLEDASEGRRLLRLHGGVHGVEDSDDVAGRGDAGGDIVEHGHEPELRAARGVRGVEGHVEHGDGEPPRVERVGQLQHRVDVALERQREKQHAAAWMPWRAAVAGDAAAGRDPWAPAIAASSAPADSTGTCTWT